MDNVLVRRLKYKLLLLLLSFQGIFCIDRTFFHVGLMGADEGEGGGVVDERYITLGGGCTV